MSPLAAKCLSELYKIRVKIVTFVSLRGAIAPIAPIPGSAPAPKRVLCGRTFVGKIHTKLFGQVWRLRAKILRKLKILPAPTLLQRGGKSGKISLSPLETKKHLFLQKINGKMSNFKILEALPSPPTPTPLKRFVT